MKTPNQSAAANRRPAGQSNGSGNLAAIVAAARAFPAAVAELVSCQNRDTVISMFFRVFFCCLMCFGVPLKLRAQVFQIDQSNNGPTHMYYSLLSLPIGQEFVPSYSSLNAVDLLTYGANGPVTATFQVRIHSGSFAGPVVGLSDPAFVLDSSTSLTHFSFPTSVSLTPGSTYVMELTLTSGAPAWWAVGYDPSAAYSQGRMVLSGSPTTQYDLWFQEGIVVPEPGTSVLLFLGIAAFAIVRRKR